MLFNDYKSAFSDGNIGRYDITPIFSDNNLFKSLIDDLIFPFATEQIDKIVCLDAIGFILGTAVALKLNKGLILIRKEGKLPLKNEVLIKKSFIDYTGHKKTFELNPKLLSAQDNILIIDDWIETGEQMRAAIFIIKETKANIIGISVIGADRNEKTEFLFKKYNLYSIGINV